MFCPQCGTPLPEDAAFCGECGKAMPTHASSNPAATTTEHAIPHSSHTFDLNNMEPALTTIISKVSKRNVAIAMGVILTIAFFLPFFSISLFGYELDISFKDSAFGLETLNDFGVANGGAEPIDLIMLVAPLIITVASLAVKKAQPLWATNLTMGIVLLAFTAYTLVAYSNSGYSLFVSLGISAYVYLILSIATTALSAYALYTAQKASAASH